MKIKVMAISFGVALCLINFASAQITETSANAITSAFRFYVDIPGINVVGYGGKVGSISGPSVVGVDVGERSPNYRFAVLDMTNYTFVANYYSLRPATDIVPPRGTVRFVAEPNHAYRIYFDPERNAYVPVAKAGKLLQVPESYVTYHNSFQSFDNSAYIQSDGSADSDLNHNGVADVNEDFDGDGISNKIDNCPSHANHDQRDRDHDGVGDSCDLAIKYPSVHFSDGPITSYLLNSRLISPVWLVMSLIAIVYLIVVWARSPRKVQ